MGKVFVKSILAILQSAGVLPEARKFMEDGLFALGKPEREDAWSSIRTVEDPLGMIERYADGYEGLEGGGSSGSAGGGGSAGAGGATGTVGGESSVLDGGAEEEDLPDEDFEEGAAERAAGTGGEAAARRNYAVTKRNICLWNSTP